MCCSSRRLLLQDAQTATFFFLPLLLLPLSVFCYFAPLETFPHSHRNTIIWNPFPSLETAKTPAAVAADTYPIVHTHHPQGTPGHKRRTRIPEHRDPQSTPPICCNDPSGNGSRKVIQGVFEGIGGGYSACKHIGIRVSKRLWWSLLTNETIIWPCSPFLSVPGSVDWLQLGWCIGSSPHPYLQGVYGRDYNHVYIWEEGQFSWILWYAPLNGASPQDTWIAWFALGFQFHAFSSMSVAKGFSFFFSWTLWALQ